ncbi:MAG: helix-turn-helix domain-containing protein [Kiritimatiellales bacterium]|nr:helix-turn-helix domain-containing protein [Kiritimatiellales bacterium]MCF7864542.1 helix-turn-helix domain-containing protein [Kiritimatiellales bacterium]
MNERLAGKDFFDPNHLPLCVFRMPYVEWGRGLHSHSFNELMIVIGGVAIHHMDGEHVTVSMGDVFSIPPGHAHGYDVEDNSGVQVLNVLFDLDRMKMKLMDLVLIPGFHALFTMMPGHNDPHLKLAARDLAVVTGLVEEIEAEMEGLEPGYEFLCEAKFREMIVFLSRRYSHVSTSAGKDMLRLGELITYMEKHLGDNLCFENLAEVANMSPTSLRRTFSEILGVSPMTYLQQLRVKKSMQLLVDPMRAISDIAFSVGFNDSGYFSRVFKKEAGCSPKEFREDLGKSDR